MLCIQCMLATINLNDDFFLNTYKINYKRTDRLLTAKFETT